MDCGVEIEIFNCTKKLFPTKLERRDTNNFFSAIKAFTPSTHPVCLSFFGLTFKNVITLNWFLSHTPPNGPEIENKENFYT